MLQALFQDVYNGLTGMCHGVYERILQQVSLVDYVGETHFEVATHLEGKEGIKKEACPH